MFVWTLALLTSSCRRLCFLVLIEHRGEEGLQLCLSLIGGREEAGVQPGPNNPPSLDMLNENLLSGLQTARHAAAGGPAETPSERRLHLVLLFRPQLVDNGDVKAEISCPACIMKTTRSQHEWRNSIDITFCKKHVLNKDTSEETNVFWSNGHTN